MTPCERCWFLERAEKCKRRLKQYEGIPSVGKPIRHLILEMEAMAHGRECTCAKPA